MTLGCSPCAIKSAACECRKSWNVQGGPTDASTAGSQMRRRKLLRRIGPPYGAEKMRPEPSAYIARWAASTSTRNGGTRTVRRDASDLGSLKKNWPLLSTSEELTRTIRRRASNRTHESMTPRTAQDGVTDAFRTLIRFVLDDDVGVGSTGLVVTCPL
jgi:hypothetical protein